jgi:hypothetical protein
LTVEGAVFWIGAVAFSLSAAIGFAASTRGYAVAAQGNLIESRNAWEAKIIRVEKRLDVLGTPRPANVVEAEITSLLRTPGTEDCGVINGPVTRKICPQVDKLRRELAASKEAARLEADLVADRQAFSEMPDAVPVADPQSAALKRLTGVDEDAVRASVAMLIAFLVEFGSALGFTLTILAFRQPATEQRGASSRNRLQPISCPELQSCAKKPRKLQIVKAPEDLVTCWALDRLDIVSSGSLQADDAFQDFREWCLVHELQPLTPQMFGRRFTKVHAGMGGRKVRRRGRAYYVGTALHRHHVEATPRNGNRSIQRIERTGA